MKSFGYQKYNKEHEYYVICLLLSFLIYNENQKKIESLTKICKVTKNKNVHALFKPEIEFCFDF